MADLTMENLLDEVRKAAKEGAGGVTQEAIDAALGPMAKRAAELVQEGGLVMDDEAMSKYAEEHMQKVVNEAVAASEKAAEAKWNTLVAESDFIPPGRGAGGLAEITKSWPLKPNQLLERNPNEELAKAQRLSDDVHLLHAFGSTGQGSVVERESRAAGLVKRYLDMVEAPENLRALVTGTAGGASEWVPTILSSQVYQLIEDALVIAPLFDSITMQSKNVDVPTITGDADVYIKTEASAVTEDASVTSGKISFVAVPLATRRRWSEELDDDSILSVMDFIRARLARGLARSIDLAILNGDTDTTHHDSDVSAGDPRKAWIGLREKALTDTGANVDLGTFNLDNLTGIPKAMGKYADIARLSWLVESTVFWGKLPVLKDASGNAVFLPGLSGPASSPVITGMPGVPLLGIPITHNTLMRADLTPAGVYDGVTTDNTWMCLVNRDAWLRGVRKEVSMVVGYDEEGGYFKLVSTWRGDFRHMEGTALTTAMGRNIDSS